MAHTLKQTAHRAGLVYFIFMIFGILGEFVIPSFFVTGDPFATAQKIAANETLFRVALLNDMFTLSLFIFLVAILYKLFREVDRNLSLLMVLLVTVGVAVAFANMNNKYAALTLATADSSFSAIPGVELNTLAYGFMRIHGRCSMFSVAFWGLWLFPFGLLVSRSGFLPRLLGYLLIVAGIGYCVTSAVSIVFPEYRSTVNNIMTPLYFGEVPIIFWLLIKGAIVPEGQTVSTNG